MPYYVYDDNNNKYEGLTKEQILALIQTAQSGGRLIPDTQTAVFGAIKETNKNTALTFWVGTQAEYNALANHQNGCFYIITDDDSVAGMQELVNDLDATVTALNSAVTVNTNAIANNADEINSINRSLVNMINWRIQLQYILTPEKTNLTFDSSKYKLYGDNAANQPVLRRYGNVYEVRGQLQTLTNLTISSMGLLLCSGVAAALPTTQITSIQWAKSGDTAKNWTLQIEDAASTNNPDSLKIRDYGGQVTTIPSGTRLNFHQIWINDSESEV